MAKAKIWRKPKKTTATSAKKPERTRPKRTYARVGPVVPDALYVPLDAMQTERTSPLYRHHAKQQLRAKCTIKARNWQLKLPRGLIAAFIKILLDHATPAG